MARRGAIHSSLRRGWKNQKVCLYHGTLHAFVESITKRIDLHLCDRTADFGRGFYTTTRLDQARKWAAKRSRFVAESSPAVVAFEVDRNKLAPLESIWFVRGRPDAEDYWRLVTHCRDGGADHARSGASKWYDVAVGPVAAVWEQRIAFSDLDQISFHTARAVRILDKAMKWVPP
jgi:hypothetical protein